MIFYAVRPQDPLVQSYVRTIWYIAHNADEAIGTDPRMIPDGCYHMVINLGDPHFYMDNAGRRIRPKRSHMNAKQTEYVTIMREGQVEIMGVVFSPHGLYPFLQMPVGEFAGGIRNMEDFLTDRCELLEEQLMTIPTVQGKCRALELWLQRRYRAAADKVKIKREIAAAGDLLIKNRGRMRIRDLAAMLALSERTLERQFSICYGVTPKQFAEVRRIHDVLHRMRAQPGKMIDYAVMGDYYDQAHFTRVFKNMVGVTPRIYMQNRDLLSDLYNTDKRQGRTMIAESNKE